MGQGHGQPETQNPSGLRFLPQPRPYRAPSHIAHAVVAGEPDDRETIKSGSAGGRAEKDQPQRLAPRCAAHPSGWLILHRRLVRDYETLPERSQTMIHWAMIDNMSRTLTAENTQTWHNPKPEDGQITP